MLFAPVLRNARGFEVVVIAMHFVLKAVAVGGFFKERVLVIKRADDTGKDEQGEDG
jgi:hypothetical protein